MEKNGHAQAKPGTTSTILQLLIGFVIPLIILTRFSGEDQLGPVRGLLLALAFPVALEAYGMRKRRKPSILSLLAIGGIMITGAIGLLGLSENWLALRRSVPYAVVSLAIAISMLIKRPLLPALLPHILDMDKVSGRIKKPAAQTRLEQGIRRSGYLLAALFLILAIASFALTAVAIDSPTDTAGFNQEYARLRVISLPAILLPMAIGLTGILYYLVSLLEKLTSLGFEDILKKR